MGGNRHAHPNESSAGCVFCVPEVIFAEVSAVKSTRCPLCLPKLHADVVRRTLYDLQDREETNFSAQDMRRERSPADRGTLHLSYRSLSHYMHVFHVWGNGHRRGCLARGASRASTAPTGRAQRTQPARTLRTGGPPRSSVCPLTPRLSCALLTSLPFPCTHNCCPPHRPHHVRLASQMPAPRGSHCRNALPHAGLLYHL